MATAARLPREVRPRIFATFELILDLVHIFRTVTPNLDLESLLIFAVINEAAMRPLLIGPDARLDLIDDPMPPDDVRGSISRNVIAERTQISRETVRRKVNDLIALGLVEEATEGALRPIRALASEVMHVTAEQCFQTVQRYDRRLRSLGCAGVTA